MVIGIIFLLIVLYVFIYGDFFEDLPHIPKKYTKLCLKNPNNILDFLYTIIYVFMFIASLGGYIVGFFRQKNYIPYDKNEFNKKNIKIFIVVIVLTIFVIIPFVLFLADMFANLSNISQ